MALNFPDPTDSLVYVDSSTGLKYIFNTEVQAWESAIQPPVIVTSDQPNVNVKGFLWYDPSNDTLYIRDNGQWNQVGDATSGVNSLTVSVSPPSNPTGGDLWWDSSILTTGDVTSDNGGKLYIFYVDNNSSQWMEASPTSTGSVASTAAYGSAQPPFSQNGSLWYDTGDSELKVLTASGWVDSSTAIAGVSSVAATAPLTAGGVSASAQTGAVTVAIGDASTTVKGAVRLSTNAEATAGALSTVALTPASLTSSITSYLPTASTTVVGIVELATVAEAQTGTDDTKAVTPAGLKSAANTLANPIGTIILFGGATPPTGYLACDGTSYTRAAYPDLATVITGDTSTQTFQVPNLTGTNTPRSPETSTALVSASTQFLPLNGVLNYLIKF